MVVAGEVGFLLREKLTEFLVLIRWTRFCQTIFWGFGFGKTETNFFEGNSDLVSRAEEGSGEESARASGFLFWRSGLNYKKRKNYLFTKARVLGPKYPVPFLSPFGVRISLAWASWNLINVL